MKTYFNTPIKLAFAAVTVTWLASLALSMINYLLIPPLLESYIPALTHYQVFWITNIFMFILPVIYFLFARVKWMVWAIPRVDNKNIFLEYMKSQGYLPKNDTYLLWFATAREHKIISAFIADAKQEPSTDQILDTLDFPITYKQSPLFSSLQYLIWIGIVMVIVVLSFRDELYIITAISFLPIGYMIIKIVRSYTADKATLRIDERGISVDDMLYEWRTVDNLEASSGTSLSSHTLSFTHNGMPVELSTFLFNADSFEVLAAAKIAKNMMTK